MSNRLELVKSNTIQFKVDLVKKSLSDWLIDEIMEIDEEYENNPILRSELNKSQNIKQLKEFLDREIKHRNRGLYESCLEEVREIKEDLQWLKSEDGKLILKLEDWVLHTRSRIKSEGWEKVFVGRSLTDPKQLNIGGLVRGEHECSKIKTMIAQWLPPVPPNYSFEVE